MKKKKWTIIMLISAESNLFQEMIAVMEELYSVTSSDQVNFVVLFDGIATERFSQKFARPSIYEVKGNISFMLDNPVKSGSRANENLTSEENLEEMLSYIRDNYEAEQYGFIYKGHGGQVGTDVNDVKYFKEVLLPIKKSVFEGTEKQVERKLVKEIRNQVKLRGWDIADNYILNGYTRPENKTDNFVMVIFSKSSKGKILSYKRLSRTLLKVFSANGSKKKTMDFVFLDCCWGQLIESAFTFSTITDYFIASADEMPAAGIGYADFYRNITSRPRINNKEIANLLVSTYYTNKYFDYDDGTPNPEKNPFFSMGVSLTNLCTIRINDFIKEFTSFCTFLNDQHNFEILFPIFHAARNCCKDYTYNLKNPDEYAMYNIDLPWFLENLSHFSKRRTFPKIPDNIRHELQDRIIRLQLLLIHDLRRGFLSSNYKDAHPGKLELGGNGITITFPETSKQINNSILQFAKSEKSDFYDQTGWEDFIKRYAKKLKELNNKLKRKNLDDNDKKVVDAIHKSQNVQNISSVQKEILAKNTSTLIKNISISQFEPIVRLRPKQ